MYLIDHSHRPLLVIDLSNIPVSHQQLVRHGGNPAENGQLWFSSQDIKCTFDSDCGWPVGCLVQAPQAGHQSSPWGGWLSQLLKIKS